MDEFSPKNLPAATPPSPAAEAPASFYANPQAMHPQTEIIYTQVVLPDRGPSSEVMRVKLAWAKLLWLLVFLGALLTISYVVPYVIEETNYSATRGKMRAEHEHAGNYARAARQRNIVQGCGCRHGRGQRWV